VIGRCGAAWRRKGSRGREAVSRLKRREVIALVNEIISILCRKTTATDSAQDDSIDWQWRPDMLAEKFLLTLEALIRNQNQTAYSDGAPRVVSSSPHVPVKLQAEPKR
jgi:hypothetical protein